jgi:hypothetical protein
MKSFFYLLLKLYICACIFLCPRSANVQAQAASTTPTANSYACILSNDVFFYSQERKGLFLLPETYYVKILEYGEEYCKVEYGDSALARPLVGYAQTSQLTFVAYLPRRPYLSYTFDVSYTIENGAITDSSFLTQITVNCVYYGDYKIGSELYCYVLRGEEYGYIPKPRSISYEENCEYADYLASLKDSTSQSASKNTSSPTQIGILIALCFLVPLLAALILKPSRKPPYEED